MNERVVPHNGHESPVSNFKGQIVKWYSVNACDFDATLRVKISVALVNIFKNKSLVLKSLFLFTNSWLR